MPKLHELLAVESNLKSQADQARKDLMNTFEKKRHHFTESLVTFESNEENVQPVTETQSDLQTTVPKEIEWLAPFLQKAIDGGYQVAEANTQARADVILEDGTILLSSVPATALLELEKRMKEVQDFIAQIPTLDPAKGFRPDPDRGVDIFKARDVEKVRTKKEIQPVVLHQGTDKHPPQVQAVSVDVPTGTIKQQEWSGLITTADKGLLLERIEEVIRAVRKARSRANETEIAAEAHRIGRKLLRYVFNFG